MITTILVPTDGSETARKAVEYSAGLAKQTQAKVILISVIDKSALVAQTIPAEASLTHLAQPIEEYLEKAAAVYLDEARKICKKKGIQAAKVVRKGHPVEEIMGEAEKSGADLIVIGSHGKSAITSAVLGSVTFGIIHKDTKIPVLVVRR